MSSEESAELEENFDGNNYVYKHPVITIKLLSLYYGGQQRLTDF